MSNPLEAASYRNSTKLLILLPLRAIYFYSLYYETPCIIFFVKFNRIKSYILTGILENDGKDCWSECNQQDGRCNWCGTRGWCCKLNSIGNGCNGLFGGENNHQCKSKPGIGGLHLVDLIIRELKDHMTCYKFKCTHWWKIDL